MNGGKECEGGDREGHTPIAQVPIGWQREADSSRVVYISPSGSVLSCLEQVKTYLLTDGTCKCGLECPLILPKVFNFDPGATVRQRTAEDAKADEDVTKLCIHKRKIIAVAALHRSMGSPHPSVALSSPGGGTGSTSMVAQTPQAIRNKLHEGVPTSVVADCKNPFKALLAGQRQYQQDLSTAQQHELYPGHPKQRLGSGEHGQRSPYRAGHGSLLSPASSGSLGYGDGPLSPRVDTLGSPDALAHNSFRAVASPTPLHGHGRTAMSPPATLRHSSPVPQLSCAMAGRTNVPLSPTVAAKSPVMKKPACSFPPNMDMPRTAFHHKPQPGPHPQHLPPLPLPCVLQKKQVTSEKDPLGILDPIPSKPMSQSPIVMNPPGFQPSVHSQVPVMNVNIPPAIVPLPSNLPLPTVKPGPTNHGGHPQRLQHAVATTSVSPSPVTSPAHLTASTIGRVEASPQRSRSSSTSSDHGSFIMPSGPQATCGSMKPPPRSPRSSMGSPRPSMPSSPSTKTDALHSYKDLPNQLLGMNNVLNSQPNSMFPPASPGRVPQNSHAGLLGMPLNQILNQHNAASFPASSLLSAAAKAQLANQNKLTGNGISSSAAGSGSGTNGTSSALSSGGGPDGRSTLNSMFPPGPNALLSSGEGQSGRAALRDKLMAQQRDPLRKRKLSTGGHSDVVLDMLKSQIGGTRPPGPPEQLRRPTRPGALPTSTSMAQLLQSMSCQSSHATGSSGTGCMGPSPGGPCGPSQMHYVDGTVPSGPPQQHLTALQRLHSGDGLHHHSMDAAVVQSRDHGPHGSFTRLANQVLSSAPSTGCGPLGNPHPHHPQPQGYSHARARTTVPSMAPNSNGGSCVQTEQGDTSSLNIRLNKSQLDRLQSLVNHGQMVPQHGQPPHVQGLQSVQGFQSSRSFPENSFPEHSPSNPMAYLFQNFQVSLPESISVPNKHVSPQSGMTSLPEAAGLTSLQQLRDAACEPQAPALAPSTGMPSAEGLPGGRVDSVDAIYRAVVDAASRGVHVEITAVASGTTQASPVPALSAMSAFAASSGEPVNLPHAVSAVIHGQRAPLQDMDTQLRPPRGSRPRRNSEQGKSTPESDHFRSPGRGTPRRQWEGEMRVPAVDGATQWRGEEFLECSTQVRSSSPRSERTPCPAELSQEHTAFLEESLHFSSCKQAAANFKERLEQTVERCAHMNGGVPHPPPSQGYRDVLGPSRQELQVEDQSPGSSTSLEGPLAKDYGHYNGHYNGCAPSPSDTKSLSSEEDLRHPDSPSSNELLHYRPPRTFHMGDLVWGQIKGFPPWAGKLVGEGQGLHSGIQNNQQGRVEPEKLKTLSEDLEALNRATKLNRKGGKLNNHFEAAIHEAMSELDKISGNVHQIPTRDRQVKPPKPKRRKISR